MRRDADGELHFPRTDPAVIMAVHDGAAGPQGRILLGANVVWAGAARRRYSVLAGFVEAGRPPRRRSPARCTRRRVSGSPTSATTAARRSRTPAR
ncbi:hypothetical protein ACFQZ4_29085 [Catellatospora coxensis]